LGLSLPALVAVDGVGDVVDAMANRRILGPGWSRRILQSVLVEAAGNAPLRTGMR
jgi:hypothetical protein